MMVYEICSKFIFVSHLHGDEVCTYIIIISDKKLSNVPAIMNDEIHILILYCYDAERMAW